MIQYCVPLSKWGYICLYIIVPVFLGKYFYSLTPIFVVSTKRNDTWVLASSITGNNQWDNCISLDFLFSWLNWTMKSAKMRTSRLIMIGQYMWPSICWNGWPNYKSGHGNRFVFTNNRSGISFQSLTPKWLAMDALWQQRKSKLVNNEFTVTRMRQTNNSVWNKNLFYRPSSPLREIIDINKILINVLK